MLNFSPCSRGLSGSWSGSWRAPAVAAALALGAALAGCGPSKSFCKDAMDNGYVCEPISDAAPPTSDVYDGPEEERGVTVVGDDETGMGDAGTNIAPDAPADVASDAGAAGD